MIFWFALVALCSFAAVALAVPLVRRYEAQGAARASSTAIYADQLKEVERDQASGTISEQEAEAAKLEIQRRLIANSGSTAEPRPMSPAWKMVALASTAAFIVLGSINLYAWIGSPDFATRPPAAQAVAVSTQAPAAMPAQPQTPQPVANAGQPGQVNDMIGRLQQRLKDNPKDAEGWRMLGWSLFNTQKYQESADAYEKALSLDPANADYKSSLAESIIQAQQGMVTPKAQALIADVLAKDPKESRARFYDALAHEQAGDQAGALDRWLALLGDAPLDAPWRDDVKQHVTDLGKATGRDVAAATATPSLPAAAGQQLGKAEQNAMIEGMIAKLATKLEQNPKDRDGWAMMIRSLTVKGDKAGADQALAKALEIFKDDPETMAGLKNVAQGLPPTGNSNAASAEAPAPAAAAGTSSAPVVTAEQQAAIQAMPQGDQQAMIKSMVAKLADRLAQNPNDAEGWIRLMRSYTVLQDQTSAKAALEKALAAFASDPATQEKLKGAAAGMGIN